MLNSPISYVTSENIFTKEECQRIIDFGISNGSHTEAKIGNADYSKKDMRVVEDERKTELYFFSDTDTYEKIMPHIATINNQVGWNFSVSRIEPLQLGIYKDDAHYDWHIDEHPYPYDDSAGPFKGLVRKLSFSILLNDKDYEGGDFELEDQLPDKNPRSTIIENFSKAGDMILFPSFTPHKVHPVTKGTRYSLVGWVCGEPWR